MEGNLVDLTSATPDRVNTILIQDSPEQGNQLSSSPDLQVMSPTQENPRLSSQGTSVHSSGVVGTPVAHPEPTPVGSQPPETLVSDGGRFYPYGSIEFVRHDGAHQSVHNNINIPIPV